MTKSEENENERSPNKSNWGNASIEKQHIVQVEETMSSGHCIGASDGSKLGASLAHSWSLADELTEKTIISGCCSLAGEGKTMSSFRAEAMGIIAVLDMIYYVEKLYPKSKFPPVRVYCDNYSVIQKVKKTQLEFSTKHAIEDDTDVILEIRSILNALHTRVMLLHVKGHQDQRETYETLPFNVRLNIDRDKDREKERIIFR